MGRRGPAPKPSALRVLEGVPGHHRPILPNEPKPRAGVPECPSWLDANAKEEWRRIVPILKEVGLLTVADGAALASYCQAWSALQEASLVVQKQGQTFMSPNGFLQNRPEMSTIKSCLLTIKSFCQEFGMTPSARSRMSITPETEEPQGMAALLD